MSLVLGLALGGTALLVLVRRDDVAGPLCRLLFAAPVRHPHMAAMDVLADLDPFPHGACWCGGALDEDGRCPDRCARDSWDNVR